MRLQNLYKELKRTGDLYEMYDGMTGIYEDDKIKFKNQQEALESFSNNIEVNTDYEEFIN
jgi:hypothetical protein